MSVISVIGERGVFAAEDAIETRRLTGNLLGVSFGPTPYLVTPLKEAHYTLVDTGSQVNTVSERLVNQLQLSLPTKAGSPLELRQPGSIHNIFRSTAHR